MCGIAFILCGAAPQDDPPTTECSESEVLRIERADVVRALAPRGPDGSGHHDLALGDGVQCALVGTVLHMRGPRVVRQPLVDEETGGALLWNGEVFGGNLLVGTEHNDTEEVLSALQYSDNVLEVLEGIEGPFAFVFWQPVHRRLWFGRDKLGRRSLVRHSSAVGGVSQLVISSVPVAPGEVVPVGWQEVPVAGIFSIDLGDGMGEVREHPWARLVPRLHGSKPDESITSLDVAVDRYLQALSHAVQVRVCTAPTVAQLDTSCCDGPTGAPVAILFSGGIDCMLLAALAHQHVPPHLPVDLLTVAFGAYPRETPDRVGSINGLRELRGIAPDRRWNLVEIDLTAEEAEGATARIVQLIHPCDTVMDLNIATALWAAARGTGVVCEADQAPALQSRVVRYSAVDGTALGGSTTSVSAPSDGSTSRSLRDTDIVPEPFRPLCEALWALSATHSSVDEERVRLSLLGGPEWPLPWKDLGYRKMKLYVKAARDAGVVETGPEGDSMPWCKLTSAVREAYASCSGGQQTRPAAKRAVSTARALLLGIGADETLAGYGRHRTTFLRGGAEALMAELELDFGRLWRRNLGRDDRVLSDWGKESRLPYLDEGVLDVVRRIPLEYRCNLAESLGVGDKKLIRLAAQRLGLTTSTMLQKRAIQFGTRIANRKLDGQRRLDGTEPLPPCLNPRVCGR